MLNNNVKYKNIVDEMNTIYEKYYLERDEEITNKHEKFVKIYSHDIKKYRKKTIKLVEKFAYDYYNLIKNIYPGAFGEK